MRKIGKKLLSLALALVMVVGMVPGAAFAADSDFTIENGVLWKYYGSGGAVTIPDGVTRIGADAFSFCKSLTGVSIPNSVTDIEEYAFRGCTGLTSVTIPNSVTRIGWSAFQDCTGLTSVIIPNSVTRIVGSVFQGCTSLTSVTIPDGVTRIGGSAFQGCTSLTRVTIPDGVTCIEESAFWSCTGLTSVTIPNSVTSIGNNAFGYCRGLTNVTIPDGVTYIGVGAFNGCNGLTSVTIPNSVTSISKWAFSGCTALTDIYFRGTETQWQQIDIEDNNESLLNATIHYNSTGPDSTGDPNTHKDGIVVFSTEKSLTVQTGESMWLGFGLITNNEFPDEWKKMAIVVSDPTVISISEYEKTEYGYSVQVIGKKQGVTNVTISDSESGQSTVIAITVRDAYTGTYSYDIENMETFYPQNNWEDEIETNIYDLNGLYVNNYACHKEGDHYNITLDVYNSKYHTGAVDIYDANGNWSDCEKISKKQMISSLWDTGEQAYYLVSDAITGKMLTYEQASFSEQTSLSFEVPVGGYFTISNNFAESPGVFLYNTSDIVLSATKTLIGAASDVKEENVQLTAFSDLIKEEIKENKSVREEFMEIFKNTAKGELRTFAKNLVKNQREEAFAGIAGLYENIITSLNLDWKHLFQTATGVGESAFEKFAGPAGTALKGCFAFTSESSQLMQSIHLGQSVDAPCVTVYSSIDEGFINPHGIVVNTNGNVDVDTEFHAFRVSNDDTIETILDGSGSSAEKYELYNICFVKNDQLVQPNGKVTVRIPIPDGMRGDTCTVYRQEKNKAWTIITAHKEGNYLVFETDHFSLYAIVGSSAELEISSSPNKLVYTIDETLNTDGLKLNLDGVTISSGFICEPVVFSGVGTQKITVRYGLSSTEFSVTVIGGNNTSAFTDVPSSSYYHDAVYWAAEKEIVKGTSSTKFTPSRTCTTAEIITFLWRAAGKPSSSAQLPFTVNKGLEYAEEALRWAYGKGMIDADFNQTAPCTRASAVKYIWQAGGSPAVSTAAGFTDVPAGADYAQAVAWAVSRGIVKGTSSTTFSPNSTCTRAQIVTFLYRDRAGTT